MNIVDFFGHFTVACDGALAVACICSRIGPW